jgi:hypothetical protein
MCREIPPGSVNFSHRAVLLWSSFSFAQAICEQHGILMLIPISNRDFSDVVARIPKRAGGCSHVDMFRKCLSLSHQQRKEILFTTLNKRLILLLTTQLLSPQ